MANITVDANTRLYKLQALTSHEGDATKTLRAKHNERGDLVLYVKEGKSSFLDKVLGRAERRENRANEAVKTIFSNEMNALKDVKHGVQRLDEFTQGSIGQKPRTGEIKTFASAVRLSIDMLPPRLAKADSKIEVGGLGLRDLGVDAGIILRAGKDLSVPSGERLGDRIASGFRTKPGVGQEDLHAFGRSGAMRLREELTALLTNGHDASHEIKAFVDTAVNRAVSQMLPDQVVANSARTIGGQSLPNIMVGGREFAPTKLLGEGGFGMAFEYENVGDSSEKIALKVPRNKLDESTQARADAVADFANEAALHKKAQGEGSEHVLGLKSEIRFPDGRLAITMEVDPHGTATDLGVAIKERVADGTLSADVGNLLRLTMIKDMALGLQHMANQNVLHLDFKCANCFVGQDGTVKVADFGGSKDSRRAGIDDMEAVANPLWLAPEVVAGRHDIRQVTAEGNKAAAKASATASENIKGLLPNATDRTIKGLAAAVGRAKTEEFGAQATAQSKIPFLDGGVDMWGLGSSALNMFTGKFAAERGFMSESEEILERFAASGGEPLSTTHGEGANSIGAQTGDEGIDRLLTGLLQAKPEDRSKPAQVLENQVFGRLGVGSAEAKALLVAIKGTDNDAIQQAKAAFDRILV